MTEKITKKGKSKAITKIEKIKNSGVTEYLHYLECEHIETRLKKLVSPKMVCTQCKNVVLVQPSITEEVAIVEVVVEEVVVEEYEDVSTNSTKFSFTHSPPEPPFVEPVRVVEEVVEVTEEFVEPPKIVDFVVATSSVEAVKETVMDTNTQIENLIINQIASNLASTLNISSKQVDIVISDNSEGFVIKFAKVFFTGDDISKITSRNVDFS